MQTSEISKERAQELALEALRGGPPVIVAPLGNRRLRVSLAYTPGGNRGKIKRACGNVLTRPEWDKTTREWRVAREHLETLVRGLAREFDVVLLVREHQAGKKCAPACWNAKRLECECSCLGANHGSGRPAGEWKVIHEDTCAIRLDAETRYSLEFVYEQRPVPIPWELECGHTRIWRRLPDGQRWCCEVCHPLNGDWQVEHLDLDF